MPHRGRISLHTTKHEPNRLRAATSRSPVASSAPSEVNTAAIPVAVAKAAGAPSISLSRSSNMVIVGLPYREYTYRSISPVNAFSASAALAYT